MKPILVSRKAGSLRIPAIFITVVIAGIIVSFLLYKPDPVNKVLLKKKDLAVPKLSHQQGGYTGPFNLVLQPGERDAKVYFTTDGSIPRLTSQLYTSPISIIDQSSNDNVLSNIPTSPRWKMPLGKVPKATVIRALTVRNDSLASDVVTATYFINQDFSLPVISLVTEFENLFGYDNGIYVMGKAYADKDNYTRKNIRLDIPWWEYPANYKSRGSNAERPINAAFFGFAEEPVAVNAGVRISGNATRGFSQKSLRLIFKKQYGTPQMNFPLFGSEAPASFSSLVLRNAGNDWDKAMLRDAFMQSLLYEHTSLDLQHSRPVILFINGEYWGIHYLTERQDENYLFTHYGIDPNDITIIENSGELFYGNDGEADAFMEMVKFAEENDLSIPGNYQRIAGEIDIDNFIDYVLSETYFVNNDWPNNNAKAWKAVSRIGADTASRGRDSRWRWMVSDLDWGFGYTSEAAYNENMFIKLEKHNSAVAKLFRALSANREFRMKLAERGRHHLEKTFEPVRVIKHLDELAGAIAPEMERHISRWRMIASVERWDYNLEVMRNFARSRPAVFREQLNSFIARHAD